MKDFSIEKKGYNKTEVEDFLIEQELNNNNALKNKQAKIDELREENIKLTKIIDEYKQKEASISKALTSATIKAEEIEDTAKLKYSIQLKNLNGFYEKWSKFFDELLIRYPKMQDFDTNKVLENIQNDITKLLKNEFQIDYVKEKQDKKEDAFSSLLNKLKKHKTNCKKVKIEINKKTDKDVITDSENDIEFTMEHNKVNNIKPITNLTIDNDEKDEYESLLDKFLHTNNNVSKGYEKSILNKNKKKILKTTSNFAPNESGFDLNEALNPTEDLLKIMKGFKLD